MSEPTVFQKLIAIASRIHKTEASRTDLLSDLASISEAEYKELSQGKFVPKTAEKIECKKCGGTIFDNNKICAKCGEPN